LWRRKKEEMEEDEKEGAKRKVRGVGGESVSW